MHGKKTVNVKLTATRNFFLSPSLHYFIHIRVNEDVMKCMVKNIIAFRMQNAILSQNINFVFVYSNMDEII